MGKNNNWIVDLLFARVPSKFRETVFATNRQFVRRTVPDRFRAVLNVCPTASLDCSQCQIVADAICPTFVLDQGKQSYLLLRLVSSPAWPNVYMFVTDVTIDYANISLCFHLLVRSRRATSESWQMDLVATWSRHLPGVGYLLSWCLTWFNLNGNLGVSLAVIAWNRRYKPHLAIQLLGGPASQKSTDFADLVRQFACCQSSVRADMLFRCVWVSENREQSIYTRSTWFLESH